MKMPQVILGFIIALFGLGIIGFGFYAAWNTHQPGWAIGGFIGGAVMAGWGVILVTENEIAVEETSDDPDDEVIE